MQQVKKLLSLDPDKGELVLKLPTGETQEIQDTHHMLGAEGSVYILIDCSGSMATVDKLEQAKRGAVGFAQDAHDKGYSVGIISFADEAQEECRLTTDMGVVKRSVDGLMIDGTTNMTAAISIATGKMNDMQDPRAMVIVTDGMPDDKQSALWEAEKAKDMGITILTIGTDDADEEFLRQLSSGTDLAVKVSHEALEDAITSSARLLPGG
ncbi:MAG: vWA domain-containing protein [Patescibacteria group bacterium]